MMLQNGTYNQQQVIHSEQIMELRTNRVYGKEQVKYAPLEAGAWGYGFGSWVMDGSSGGKVSDLISSPGLFGTFPWVDYKNNYCAILVTFYLNNKGRHDKYSDLMKRVEAALASPSKN